MKRLFLILLLAILSGHTGLLFAETKSYKIEFSFDFEHDYSIGKAEIMEAMTSGKDLVNDVSSDQNFWGILSGGSKGLRFTNNANYFYLDLNDSPGLTGSNSKIILKLANDPNSYSAGELTVKYFLDNDQSEPTTVSVESDTFTVFDIPITDSEKKLNRIYFSGLEKLSFPVYLKSIEFTFDIPDVIEKSDIKLTFSSSEITLKKDESVDIPSLTTNPEVEDIDVKYTISDENIAIIRDGKIFGVSAGETSLKASFDGNDNYNPAETSLKITVSENKTPDPEPVEEKTKVTFTFEGHPNYTENYNVKDFDYIILFPQPFVNPPKAFDDVKIYIFDENGNVDETSYIQSDPNNSVDPMIKIFISKSGEYKLVIEIKDHKEYEDVRVEYPFTVKKWEGPKELYAVVNDKVVSENSTASLQDGENRIVFQGIDKDVKVFTKFEAGTTRALDDDEYSGFDEYKSPILLENNTPGKVSYYSQYKNEKSKVKSFNVDIQTSVMINESEGISSKPVIYDLNGRVVEAESITKGIYIIKRGDKIAKTVVR